MLACLWLVTFATAQELRQRPRYTLRSGDVIELQYRYTPELNQTVTVLPDGFVNLNQIGDVKLSDLTVSQAHDLIVKKAEVRLNDPDINLILREYQRPYVVVAGEVTTPGKIDLRETTTAMQAILLSGGFKQSAHSNQVLLFRKINSDTAEVKTLRLTNVHKTAQLEQDAVLEPGDMLLVPRNKLENVSRYMKLFNIGAYINPLQLVP
ncbi:MAG TPA: polysaccharide biosynthesis/export family protein [Terriglobales bacterium]|nr:polysaccharide biosynthesis/export family protein [Terriglobales bacterium]